MSNQEETNITHHHYSKYNEEEIDLIIYKNNRWGKLEALHGVLNLLESSIGKVNSITCSIRKLYNEANEEFNKIEYPNEMMNKITKALENNGI